jgi:hypothetical protein
MDHRAKSKEKITPPSPLPHVSRRALRRVKDPVAPPTECRYCQSDVALVSNSAVYGREYGDWPFVYLCTGCSAYVGLHPDTDIPLGTLADSELRTARKRAKGTFIGLSKRLRLSRDEAYAWLAEAMNIPASQCHFGFFDIEQCGLAYTACQQRIQAQ